MELGQNQMRDERSARTFFLVFLRNNFVFLNYQDYIVNKSQTIDCLLTLFLRVRSVTQTNILVGIRRLRLLWHKKIVLSFTGIWNL